METWKIGVVGEDRTGKTLLCQLFAVGLHASDTDPTMEIYFSCERFVNCNRVKLDIVDAVWSDNCRTPDDMLQDRQGFVIVYAVDDRSSFEEAERVRDYYLRLVDVPDFPIVLCGNKCDEKQFRTISKEEGEERAREWNCPYAETSAKCNENCDVPFTLLLQEMIKVKNARENKGLERMKKGKKRHGKRDQCNVM